MSRRRSSRAPLLATTLAVLALVHAAVAPAAFARTAAEPNGDVLTVTIRIDVQGEGAAEQVRKWQGIFDRVWGSLQGSNACGKKLHFKLEIGVPTGFGAPGHDLITVRQVPDGSYEVSNVTGGVDNPTGTDREGTWSSNASDAIIAHEMGHLLGLPDEYSYIDKNDNGSRDANEPSRPDPNKAPEYEFEHDWDGDGKVDWDDADRDGKWDPGEREDTTRLRAGQTASIMAGPPGNVNNILNRHLETVARQHGVSPCRKGYRFRGSVQGRHIYEDASLRAEITIEIDARLASLEPSPLLFPDGERFGSFYVLSEAGTVVRNTYLWTSKETGDTCTGEGEMTIGESGTVAQLYVEDRPLDSTPGIGFDIPDAGTLYIVNFETGDAEFPVTCTFPSDTTESVFLWPQLGRFPTFGDPPSDPEVRSLDAAGAMVGSYSITFPSVTGTTTIEATWNLQPEDEPGVGMVARP